MSVVRSLLFTVYISILTSLFCDAIVFNLVPVFGATSPSSLLSGEWLALPITLGLWNLISHHDESSIDALIIVNVSSVCLILRYGIYRYSSWIGPVIGPIMARILLCLPLRVIACQEALRDLYTILGKKRNKQIGRRKNNVKDLIQGDYTLILGLPVFYGLLSQFTTIVINSCKPYLTRLHASMSQDVLCRSEILHTLAVLYTLAFSMRISGRGLFCSFILLIISSLIHGDFPSMSHIQVMNKNLKPYDFQILETKESLTGYISVIERRNSFKVLRNDHCLLGGVWMRDPKNGIFKEESVYPVFKMLESIRLLECTGCNETNDDFDKEALVIGLGVGLAPTALVNHGIQTTALEIDPAVIRFARKYFDLHKDVIVINDDAKRYVKEEVSKFDFIIHDVFTGGAEPKDLFTVSFLQSLKLLMKPSGVIAINYAGSLSSSDTRATVINIINVFERGACRVFRDAPNDMANFVTYCSANGKRPEFRQTDDFKHLLPLEFEMGSTSLADLEKKSNDMEEESFWSIMRMNIPAVVWENY